jgi:hypothetical protein
MRDPRVPAFWKTWLFFALAGPLIGLLCFVVISLVVDAWGPMIDRLDALMPHAQDPSCRDPHSDTFGLHCFQQPPGLRQFGTLGGDTQWQLLPWLVVGAYAVGFIPALVSGLLIGGLGLFNGRVRFASAILIGALAGLVTGAVAWFIPENAVLLFLICLISTVVCWRVTQRWWRAAETAGFRARSVPMERNVL